MLQALRKRLHNDEEGFTLIELMVVVLIIAILIAIAIPTFLGAQQKAKHRQAQSNVRNALTAAKTVFSDKQLWANVAASDVQLSEPNLTVQAAAAPTPANPKFISFYVQPTVANGDYLVLAALDSTNTCYYITDTSQAAASAPPAGPGLAGTFYASVPNAAACNAASPPAATAANWTGSW